MHQPSTSVQATGRNPSVSITGEERKNRATDKARSDEKPSLPDLPLQSPRRITPLISTPRARHRRRPSKSIPMIPFGTIIQGKYELQQILGAGGYGQIFKAFDSNKNLYVAVKIMQRKHEPQRMVLEQQILYKLKGRPEFPELYGSGTFEGYMYIVMELLGKSLSEMRKKNEGKKFDATTALRVGLMITDSLKVLHEMGYLHRDVKPGNMCIGTTSETSRKIYLLDFGLARRFKDKGRVKRRTHVGFRGTLRYVSLNVHERKDQCTCDDLISNFYSMVELAEGTLPWTRLRDADDIARRKRNISFEELCPLDSAVCQRNYRSTTHIVTTQWRIRTNLTTIISRTLSGNPCRSTSTSILQCRGNSSYQKTQAAKHKTIHFLQMSSTQPSS